PPSAAGTACSQNGGVVCDGAGVCTQSFVVMRAGDGSAVLGGTTTAAFLDTYYPNVGSPKASTVALPTAASGSNQPLTPTGTATPEGGLPRSVAGHYVTFAGYAATPGNAVNGPSRVVGRVNASGTVNTSTTLVTAAFNGANAQVRCATSVDGTAFWV